MGQDRAAEPAKPPDAEESQGALLEAVVEMTQAVFHAEAVSVLLHDERTGELVFAVVTGPEADLLLGLRMPADAGIAGAALQSGEPIVCEDVTSDAAFSRAVADLTGHMPNAIMAAPLARGDRTFGVLEVLGRPQFPQFSLVEADLLALVAKQVAVALDVVLRTREMLAPADR
ncbi:MAG: GAF domain-containing protein [Gaiellales bacterium]